MAYKGPALSVGPSLATPHFPGHSSHAHLPLTPPTCRALASDLLSTAPSARRPLPLILCLADSSAEMSLFVPSGAIRPCYVSATVFLQPLCSGLPRASFQPGCCQILIGLCGPVWEPAQGPDCICPDPLQRYLLPAPGTVPGMCLITCPTNTDWTELNQVEKRCEDVPARGQDLQRPRSLKDS